MHRQRPPFSSFLLVVAAACGAPGSSDDEIPRSSAGLTDYTSPYTLSKFQDALDHAKLQYGPSPYVEVEMPALQTFANSKFYLSSCRYLTFYTNKSDADDGDRTELRQQLVAGDDYANWYVSEAENRMTATLKVAQSDMNELTLLQIHDKASSPNTPLLRIAFMKSYRGQTNHLWAVIRTSLYSSTYDKLDLGALTLGSLFSADIEVASSTLHLTANGVTIQERSVSYWTVPSYFKAGSYPQGTGIGKAYFDRLDLTHVE